MHTLRLTGWVALIIAALHMTDMSPLWLIPGYADWFWATITSSKIVMLGYIAIMTMVVIVALIIIILGPSVNHVSRRN